MSEPLDIDIKTMRARARKVMPLLKAVSNENRLLILCHLGQGELSVTELNERFDLSQSVLSQHFDSFPSSWLGMRISPGRKLGWY